MQRNIKPRKSKITLSANTLFHFTSSIDNLINILTNEFEPRYCLDQVCLFRERTAIPMVCFCDIPLSQIKDHIENYGRYAIGLSKDWGKRKGINPVLYSYPNSTLSITINSMGEALYKEDTTQTGKSFNVKSAAVLLIYTTLFTKPYEGVLIRENANPKTVRFYDEREWRYIPQITKFGELHLPLTLKEEDFKNKDLVLENQVKLASNSRLSFQPNDIRYLIVEKESEILNFVDRITDIKARYPIEDRKILHTRIMSIEHILDDF